MCPPKGFTRRLNGTNGKRLLIRGRANKDGSWMVGCYQYTPTKDGGVAVEKGLYSTEPNHAAALAKAEKHIEDAQSRGWKRGNSNDWSAFSELPPA